MADQSEMQQLQQYMIDVVFAIFDWRDMYNGYLHSTTTINASIAVEPSERFSLAMRNWRSIFGKRHRRDKLRACNGYLKRSAEKLLMVFESWPRVAKNEHLQKAVESLRSGVDSFDDRLVADVQFVSIALLGIQLQNVLTQLMTELDDPEPEDMDKLQRKTSDNKEADTLKSAIRACRSLLISANLEERSDQKSPEVLPEETDHTEIPKEDLLDEASQLHLRGGGNCNSKLKQFKRCKKSESRYSPTIANPDPRPVVSEAAQAPPLLEAPYSEDSLGQNERTASDQPTSQSFHDDLNSRSSFDENLHQSTRPHEVLNQAEVTSSDLKAETCSPKDSDVTKGKNRPENQSQESTERLKEFQTQEKVVEDTFLLRKDQFNKIVSQMSDCVIRLKALLNDDDPQHDDQDSESWGSLPGTEMTDLEDEEDPIVSSTHLYDADF